MTRQEATAIVPLIEEQTDTVALIESHLIPNPIFANGKRLGSLFTADTGAISGREIKKPLRHESFSGGGGAVESIH